MRRGRSRAVGRPISSRPTIGRSLPGRTISKAGNITSPGVPIPMNPIAFGAMAGPMPIMRLPKGSSLSPKGDLGAQRVKESHAVSRKLKAGSADKSSSYLPYQAPASAIDSKFGPGDKVC